MAPREKPISQILTRSVAIEASEARILILMVVSVIESAGTLKLVNVWMRYLMTVYVLEETSVQRYEKACRRLERRCLALFAVQVAANLRSTYSRVRPELAV